MRVLGAGVVLWLLFAAINLAGIAAVVWVVKWVWVNS